MPCQTIEEVIAEMTRRWRILHRAGDWRAAFARTYLTTTEQLYIAVRQPGTFHNPEWIERIDCEFAQRYFTAFDDWEAGRPCPWPWRLAFRSAVSKRTLVLQDVLLGMSAHINYDLPFSLDATIPRQLMAQDYDTYRRDNLQLSRILAGMANIVEEQVSDEYDMAMSVLDVVLAGANEGGAGRLIRIWRERSWLYFLLLRHTQGDSVARDEVEQIIEQTACDYAIMILELQRALPRLYWPHRIFRDTVTWLRRTRRE